MSIDPIERVLTWGIYISLAFLVCRFLWELFAFIWIVILQKKDYDRFLFWIKPKLKRKFKRKKKRKKAKK